MMVLRSLGLGPSSPALGFFQPYRQPQHLRCFCQSITRYQSTQPLPAPNHKKPDTWQLIQEKYAQKIEQKLKEKGLRSWEELKNASQDQIEADRIQRRKLYEELIQKARKNINPSYLAINDSQNHQEKKPLTPSSKKYSSPIKPLDNIIDVNKLASESASEIKKLWTAYHLSTSNPPRLGAVIPVQIYKEMIRLARKFPSFVIPLPKLAPESADKSNAAPLEMQYLQWDFISQPPEPKLPDFLKPKSTLVNSTVPATIVMYTPLAEYKLRQSFAQPTLILTHYTDLSDSHGMVLMRGDITPSSNGSKDGGKISTTDAQLLVLRLQQFYYPSTSTQEDNLLNQKRKALLQQFHEKPDQFQLSELINLVQDL